MDRYYRYFNLLKQANYGLNLRKGALSNYLKNRSKNFNEFIGKGGAYPSMLFITAARRCNLRCSFCYYQEKFPVDWQNYELTPEKFKKILNLDILKKIIVITFTGDGEPLLNQNLPELIRMARQRKYLTAMISNGTLLEERVKDITEAGLCDAQISVYENTLEKMGKILPKVSQYLFLNISYVLTKSKLHSSALKNFDDLIDMIKLFKDSGCESFKFNMCDVNHFKTHELTETICNDDILYDAFVSIAKQKIRNVCFSGYKCGISMPSRKFSVYFPNPITVNPIKRACCQNWMNINLDANSNYTPCPRIFVKLGNIFSDGEEVINSDCAQRLRRTFLDYSNPLQLECATCSVNSGGYAAVT